MPIFASGGRGNAGLLRGNHDDGEEWQRISRNGIWDAEKDNPHILPALKLSFDHLSPHLKQCYAFCSLFPKSYIFDKKELVKLWVAEGFVQSNSTGPADQETAGSQYFNQLLVRSFFQHLDVDQKKRYMMHDLIHDLATHISRPNYCSQHEDAANYNNISHPSSVMLCSCVKRLINLSTTSSKQRPK